MINNPFNLKILLPLAIQMFADGGEGHPSEDHPPQGDGGNGQGATLTLESVPSFLKDNDEGKKWLQSFGDTRVTEAIKMYETKTLPKKFFLYSLAYFRIPFS